MKLGSRFKKYRNKAGLTQKQAAEIIGINYYQLGNYETNSSEPSIAVRIGMSKAYNVSIDILVGNKAHVKGMIDIEELEQKLSEFIDSIED